MLEPHASSAPVQHGRRIDPEAHEAGHGEGNRPRAVPGHQHHYPAAKQPGACLGIEKTQTTKQNPASSKSSPLRILSTAETIRAAMARLAARRWRRARERASIRAHNPAITVAV